MSLVDLRHGFRDEAQLRLAQGVVMLRLADDREQEECRVLMKFFWQLAMTYQEVTEAELDRHTNPGKREVIQNLIDAIRQSPEAVDAWIDNASRRFPFVQDRGYAALNNDDGQETDNQA
ncbi:hypothetical protein [Paractinoplanes maris]|uniref:hypothetical protein n=1 Tax=Paractinoplanes maris TaxID=1734446 RepID=UPI002020F43F|nr:hypothetical protein [Actinoplanes maris]